MSIATVRLACAALEYTDAAFATACRRWPNLLSVRRDVALTGPGGKGHGHRRC